MNFLTYPHFLLSPVLLAVIERVWPFTRDNYSKFKVGRTDLFIQFIATHRQLSHWMVCVIVVVTRVVIILDIDFA